MTKFEFLAICGEYFINPGLVLEIDEVIEALNNKTLTTETLKEIIENNF
jgi:hypothetical protein